MFTRIRRFIRRFKENVRLRNQTLDLLHEQLFCIDLLPNHWTKRTKWGVVVFRGDKFPLYMYGHDTVICFVNFEPRDTEGVLVYSKGNDSRKEYPLSGIQMIAEVVKKECGA